MADRIEIARRGRRVQAEQFIPELTGSFETRHSLESRAKKPGFFTAAALNDTTAECAENAFGLLLRCFGHLKRNAGRVIGSWDCSESDLSVDIPLVLVQGFQIVNCFANGGRVENVSVVDLDRLNYSRIHS